MSRIRVILCGGLLLLALLATYQPALRGGFVWDDDAHVTRPELRSLHGLWRIWTELGATQQYYPLTHSLFWLQHQLWGDDPLGYHVVNLLLHAAGALLAWAVLRRLSAPGAWLAAAFFALHPVQVESVAWITELNTLSGTLYLAALFVYIGFDAPGILRTPAAAGGERRRWGRYAAACGLFVLALVSKSVSATLPAAVLLIVWWKQGRVGWSRHVVPLVPLFVAGAAMGALTAWVERYQIGAGGEAFSFSWIERCLIAGRVAWFYLGKLLWPANLLFIYPRWSVDGSVLWPYLFPAGAAVLLTGLWLSRRRAGRAPLAGALFFGGTLFPVLGFLNVYPFRFSFVADHFQYLASLGVLSLGATAIAMGLARLGIRLRRVGQAACLLLLLVLAHLSWKQCRIYHDQETLWRETVARNPASAMAHNNLGTEYAKQGRYEAALGAYDSAIDIDAGFAQAYFNLALANSKLGRSEEAISAYHSALAVRPDYAEAHYNLGIEHGRLGRPAEAARWFRAAVAARPEFAEAHYNLGTALARQSRYAEAVEAYRSAIAIRPDYSEAHLNLGMAYSRQGLYGPAVKAYRLALALTPGHVEAERELALALARRGELAAAVQAYVDLGTLLGKQGKYADAIQAFESALTLAPDHPGALFLIGLAHSRLGRYGEALDAWREVVRIDPSGEHGRKAVASIDELEKLRSR